MRRGGIVAGLTVLRLLTPTACSQAMEAPRRFRATIHFAAIQEC